MEPPNLSDDEREALRSWSNVGAPGEAPTERYVPSAEERAQFSAIAEPRTIAVSWVLTPDDDLRLRLGHRATVMEDKWHVFVEQDVAHFHRSWTGFEVFRFTVAADLTVTSFEVETLADRYNEETDAGRTATLLEVLAAVCGVRPRSR